MLRFNGNLQPIGNKAGILCGVLRLLGANYKFPICEKDGRKISSKDNIYSESVKRTILQSIGRYWKEMRNMLYHTYYDLEKTIEQNIKGCASGIIADHWG
ncbi:hypothetical protein Ahy_A03g013209 [Arachis hypogaea]|uniref:Uncharacterized protein n=1 Tax=Arachis hypogaea TaxID=3818 RepID=A0A445DUZ1_ARAHY|nr:hypothetical protein Ahy_A03g013209 [Arachis hypogaea]